MACWIYAYCIEVHSICPASDICLWSYEGYIIKRLVLNNATCCLWNHATFCLFTGWGITYMPVWRGFTVTLAWIIATYAIFKKLVMKESWKFPQMSMKFSIHMYYILKLFLYKFMSEWFLCILFLGKSKSVRERPLSWAQWRGY